MNQLQKWIQLYSQASNIVFIPYLDDEDVAEAEIFNAQAYLETTNINSQDGFQDFDSEDLTNL